MVRYYNKEDVPFLLDCLKYFSTKIGDDLFNNPFNKFLISEVNSKKVGCVQYSEYYDRIEIDYIFVYDSYRQNGLATEMLNFLFKYCYLNNIKNITLEVSEKNISAINLYKKNGFEETALRENYYGHGENAILMIRRF